MTRRYYLTGILLVAAMLAATWIAYPHLPSMVPTHWTLNGRANGFSPKWMLFLIGPGSMSALMVLFRILPKISRRRWDVDSFRPTYLYFMLVILIMLACLYGVTLWAGLGHHMSIGRVALGGICLLLALLGNVLGKVRQNSLVGVRTPWSLASKRVWEATHRLAARTIVLCGFVGLVLTAVGIGHRLTIAVLIAGGLIPTIYSLILYKRLERTGKL